MYYLYHYCFYSGVSRKVMSYKNKFKLHIEFQFMK
jgi:hypothetical protein